MHNAAIHELFIIADIQNPQECSSFNCNCCRPVTNIVMMADALGLPRQSTEGPTIYLTKHTEDQALIQSLWLACRRGPLPCHLLRDQVLAAAGAEGSDGDLGGGDLAPDLLIGG